MCRHSVAILAAFLALSSGSQALEVTIKYSDPVLEFTLPLINRGVSAVAFHYVIKHVEYAGRGIQTREGWTFATRDVSLDGADSVVAYAVVYDINGNKRMTTQRSSLVIGDSSAPVARLPNRRIRGAVLFRDDFNSFSTSNWDYEVSMYGGYTLTVDDPRFDENFLYNGKMDMTQLFGYCTQSGNYGCTREGKYGMLPPVMSGKVKSKPTLRYGIVEIRARIPQGDWLWPALWLLPKYSRYGNWPRSGEIDVMESRGNKCPIGVEEVSSTLHWGPSAGENKYYMTTGKRHGSNWADNFHTWRLEWTRDHLVTFVDNQEVMRTGANFWQKGGFGGSNLWAGGEKMAPFDQEFYMIFNVAVGGTNGFFPDGNHYNGARKPWSNGSPHAAQDFWNGRGDWQRTWNGEKTAMIIDYVEFRNL
ncbi:beta-1,3-glucan-binding protein [Elysia marginata]|uniref:Beta-1,3-glucan-binding protein n=1 Tax=Elysia marginata TaxID=1093978 RepID=A0AAV4ITK2_9GAST|nr:beta-1,3-glucan-binding protein [Elysia marginata]